MELIINPSSPADYATFLRVKSLPVYKILGRRAWFPDEYAKHMGATLPVAIQSAYSPSSFLFDYQRDITRLAIQKRKFAVFAECGLGKSLIEFEFARHALNQMPENRCALILTPLMVVAQMADEYRRFYGEELTVLPSSGLQQWLSTGTSRIAVTNWEALKKDTERGRLGCLVCDESSLFKSHYGQYGKRAIRLGKGVEWKLAGTGTPAPNDRIEYANHAVFLDQYPTVNSFLARFFVNKGQTQERWELRPHALRPFYRTLSHWCIFLSNPGTYGWKDNCESIPPIHVHIHEVEETSSQRAAIQKMTRQLAGHNPGGIRQRQKFSKIAKGLVPGVETLKYEFIRNLIESHPGESTITWCWFNEEQDRLEEALPRAGSIRGATKLARRQELIRAFQERQIPGIISKPDVLGFGLNLQVCTRQVFSSLIDSYEQFHQAVKRSNRIGSTEDLNVDLPVLEIERPMVETVLRKAKMVQQDTREQEDIFKHERIA